MRKLLVPVALAAAIAIAVAGVALIRAGGSGPGPSPSDGPAAASPERAAADPAAARAEVRSLERHAVRHARRLGLRPPPSRPAPRSPEAIARRARALRHVVGFLRERGERPPRVTLGWARSARAGAGVVGGAFEAVARQTARLGIDRPAPPSPRADVTAARRAEQGQRWRDVSAWLARCSERVRPAERNAAAAEVALRFLGTPYAYGGASPSGFDCSGLVSYAYARVGVSMPHYTGGIWSAFPEVADGDLRAGDMVFFNGLGHMGIYLGGGRYVHAPRTGDVVKVSSLAERADFVGAVRA